MAKRERNRKKRKFIGLFPVHNDGITYTRPISEGWGQEIRKLPTRKKLWRNGEGVQEYHDCPKKGEGKKQKKPHLWGEGGTRSSTGKNCAFKISNVKQRATVTGKPEKKRTSVCFEKKTDGASRENYLVDPEGEKVKCRHRQM